jgi:mono/diheme cytochrome c family protein
MSIVPNEVLKSVITDGRPGTPMPAFARSSGGSLTDDQINALASGLKLQWKPREDESKDLPHYAAGSSRGDKDRGAKLFALACAGCHGDDGSGGEKAGAINDHAFLALISDQCLRRLVITGRPDLGMPGFAGRAGRSSDFKTLTESEIDDLVALLAEWRRAASPANPSKSATAAR